MNTRKGDGQKRQGDGEIRERELPGYARAEYGLVTGTV